MALVEETLAKITLEVTLEVKGNIRRARFEIEIEKKNELRNKKNERFEVIDNISREATISSFLIKK